MMLAAVFQSSPPRHGVQALLVPESLKRPGPDGDAAIAGAAIPDGPAQAPDPDPVLTSP